MARTTASLDPFLIVKRAKAYSQTREPADRKSASRLFFGLLFGLIATFAYTITKISLAATQPLQAAENQAFLVIFLAFSATCNLFEALLTIQLVRTHARSSIRSLAGQPGDAVNADETAELLGTATAAKKSKMGDLRRLIVMAGPEKYVDPC